MLIKTLVVAPHVQTQDGTVVITGWVKVQTQTTFALQQEVQLPKPLHAVSLA